MLFLIFFALAQPPILLLANRIEPFVLGMPSTRGSKAFAWRNARAKALYSASAM